MDQNWNAVLEANKILEGRNDFNQWMGIEILSFEKGCCEAVLSLRPELLNPYGTVHGGILFGFADTIAGITAFLNGRAVVTLNSNINYIEATNGNGQIKGIVREIKYGNRIAVYHVDIYQGDILTASVETNYYVTSKEITMNS